MNFIIFNYGFNPCFFPLLLGQHKGTGQGHLTPTGRVGTLHRPCPNPCNHSSLTTALLLGHLDLGVEMADALEGFLFQPFTIIAHILRQALRPAPSLCHLARPSIRVYRSHAHKPGRNLNHGLVNHHSHRIQIMCMGFQPQPLRLQRNGSAAGEGVQQLRRIAAGGLQDFRLCRLQHPLVVGVLPDHQILQDTKQPLTFQVLLLLRGEFVRVRGRVIHQTGPDDRPGRRQRPPCPPQVQGGRMPMPY